MKFAAYDEDSQIIRGVGNTRDEAEANSTHITDPACGYVILPLSDGMQEHIANGGQPNGIDHISYNGLLMTNSEYEAVSTDD